ncbi:MAG: glycosyltransferase [Kineosporiaceae bacterium]|nr:glycosyltransferase [Kineosporiaceae bacterium]
MAELTVVVPVGPPPRPFLQQALMSLRPDFPDPRGDVIVVFDGSEPESEEEQLLNDLQATVMVLPKQGCLAEVLNRGLARATTPLITRVDADDLWVQGRLTQQLDLMRQNPSCVLAGSDATTIDSDGAVIGVLRAGHGLNLRRAMVVRNQMLHPTVIFRADHVAEAGGYPSVDRVEDYALWLDLARRGDIINTDARWVRYRIHDGQQTRRFVGRDGAREIAHRRRELGRAIGMGSAQVRACDTAWRLAQNGSLRRVRKMWWREERLRTIEPSGSLDG